MRSIALLFVLCPFNTLAAEVPADWRLPTEKELISEPSRNESLTKFARVDSDFNNDGKIDHAYLLKSVRYPGEGLLVNISSPTGYKWQLLDRVEWGEEFSGVGLIMRIGLAKPGSYKTACAYGYWECTSEDPGELKLERGAILQDRFDGASAIWYWNEGSKKFQQVWLGG